MNRTLAPSVTVSDTAKFRTTTVEIQYTSTGFTVEISSDKRGFYALSHASCGRIFSKIYVFMQTPKLRKMWYFEL